MSTNPNPNTPTEAPIRLQRALMNYQFYSPFWSVHFIREDCRTLFAEKTRYFNFPTLEHLRKFVERCNPDPEELIEFEHDVKAWGRGSIFVNLTAEQIAKLERRRVLRG